ncbi:DUF362 domain-containing protein [Ruminococcaceae bacterium OttesenSCG-928-I18]|nr:DUF362 domain-containing protein [Ruminococcaceae bacterium OttesenSCG-928-I18]
MEKNEILIEYGRDPRKMAYALASEAGLRDLIGDRGKKVGLKPNLVVATAASEGATTHPEICEGVLEYLRENGFERLVILEGSSVKDSTEEAFEACGYLPLAKRYGAELIDTKKDGSRSVDCKGQRIEICESALELDFLINLPVLKGHCQTHITCALKNNKGLIPDDEKRRFHTLDLHAQIAHLATGLPIGFVLVDAICGDLDFEEGGNPVPTNMMFAARDAVLCDAWAARFMGYAVEEIEYIGLAAELGVGEADPAKARVRQLHEGEAAGAPLAKAGGKVRKLRPYLAADAACSACEAALVRGLSRLGPEQLARMPAPVCVGQGFAGKKGAVGVGKCTAGFEKTLPGCPPRADKVRGFLQELAEKP